MMFKRTERRLNPAERRDGTSLEFMQRRQLLREEVQEKEEALSHRAYRRDGFNRRNRTVLHRSDR